MIDNNRESGFVRYIHMKAAAMKKPVSGTFELTSGCNFNCKMCYVHVNCPDRAKELTAEEWIRIAKEAADEGMLFVLLTGGEPLLRTDFDEIYTSLRKLGLLVAVNTNGSLIDEKKVALFTENPPRRLNISLYGTDEDTYEDLCGKRAFTTVKNNVEALVRAGVNVKINMSETTINSRSTDEIFEFAKSLNVPFQPGGYMFPPKRIDNPAAADCRMSPEEFARSDVRHLARYKSPSELLEYAQNALKNDRPPADCEEGELIPCRAGKCAFWLTWDGRMLPCGMMTAPEADVKSLGFSEAWRQTVSAAAEIRLPAKCASCDYRCVCSVCAAKCLCETGSFTEAPDYICRAAKEKYRLFEEIISNNK